jgi:hypothetical protein
MLDIAATSEYKAVLFGFSYIFYNHYCRCSGDSRSPFPSTSGNTLIVQAGIILLKVPTKALITIETLPKTLYALLCSVIVHGLLATYPTMDKS